MQEAPATVAALVEPTLAAQLEKAGAVLKISPSQDSAEIDTADKRLRRGREGEGICF